MVELSRFIVINSFGKLHTQIQLFFIGEQMAQSFVNCSGVLIAEMDATRSVDNDSGVGHKNRASHCDFTCLFIKYLDFHDFALFCTLCIMKKKYLKKSKLYPCSN